MLAFRRGLRREDICENNMMDHVLLFDLQEGYLGEILTEHGAFVQAILTPNGHKMMEAPMQKWQTRGIPYMREISRRSDAGLELTWFEQPVMMKEPLFLKALDAWSAPLGIRLLKFSEVFLPIWESLSRLPLNDGERFECMCNVVASPEKLAEWSEVIRDARKAVEAVKT